jgi:hypothetical protein
MSSITTDEFTITHAIAVVFIIFKWQPISTPHTRGTARPCPTCAHPNATHPPTGKAGAEGGGREKYTAMAEIVFGIVNGAFMKC